MKGYEVRKIRNSLTDRWLLEKHYAKRKCSISYAFGLYKDNILEGVCTFGMPPSSTLKNSVCGENYDLLELNRLCINSNNHKNSASFFISKCLNMLPKNHIIVSFADDNMTHKGYVYQSTNWIYTGVSSNKKKLIDRFGNEFHYRNIGHYQKNNKLKVKKIKRRFNEDKIDRVEIANYLRSNKGKYKAKDLDLMFGYKDTASHWFRIDKGFSFPSVDDWIKLKSILRFDNKYDDIMMDFILVSDSNEIIKKLELKEIDILGKHRYIYFCGNKRFKKQALKDLKYDIQPYPKGNNKRYECIDIKWNDEGSLF